MFPSPAARIAATLSLVVFLPLACPAQTGESSASSEAPVSKEASVPEVPQPVAVPEILAKLEETSAFLKSVDDRIDVGGSTENGLSDLAAQIDAQSRELPDELHSNPSMESLRLLEADWNDVARKLSDTEQALMQGLNRLESELNRIRELDVVWQATLDGASSNEIPPALVKNVRDAVDSLGNARARVIAYRADRLSLQEKVVEQKNRVATELQRVLDARQALIDDVFVRGGRRSGKSTGKAASPEALPRTCLRC